MVEGHSVHRIATQHTRRLVGRAYRATSQRLKVRPLMSAAPSAKRPLGEVARYARPTSRRVCCVAIRCTEWPSTIVPSPRASRRPSARDAKCSELSMQVSAAAGAFPCLSPMKSSEGA